MKKKHAAVDVRRVIGMTLALLILPSLWLVSMQAEAAKRNPGPRIYTCEEAGLCEKDEQRLLLKYDSTYGPLSLKYASRKGCKITKENEREIGLICKKGFSVPYARQERVFRVNDLFSAEQIGAIALHADGITGDGVRIAVLDTGIDDSHPELAGRVIAKQNFTTDVDTDLIGHGTHVAGIIAGQGIADINDAGKTNRVVGTSPQAQLLIGKICNNQGWCLEGDIIAGMEWAVAQRAKIVNMSLGGGRFLSHCDFDPLAAEANRLADKGIIVVAASGNSGNSGEGVGTPACASKAIAVGAIDSKNAHPSWSSYGIALDIVAPGAGILSSVPCSVSGSCPAAGYAWWSGTSMATPHVTGIIGLLTQIDPTLTPERVLSVLTETAQDLGATGFDSLYGFGRIDTIAASRIVLDKDGDKFLPPSDCDNENADVNPGVAEVCSNNIDDNCDAQIDEGCQSSSSSAGGDQSSSSKTGGKGNGGGNPGGDGNPPACTAKAWFCSEEASCIEGRRRVLCTLVNPNCKDPHSVRPPEHNPCDDTPNGNSGNWQGRGEGDDNGNEGENYEQEQERNESEQRGNSNENQGGGSRGQGGRNR